MTDTPDHCYWVYLEDGLATFIPMCYGGIHGPEGCTCTVPGSEIEKLRAENDRLRITVNHMRQAKVQRQRIREWYQKRIDRLSARLDQYEPRQTIRIESE